MSEHEFSKLLAKIEDQFDGGKEFVDIIEQMIDMLNETDSDDYFGSEGFRHILGWD